MKYSPSFDGTDRADFLLKVRLSKREVEQIRRCLRKKNKRALDIDVRRFVEESIDTPAMLGYLYTLIYG